MRKRKSKYKNTRIKSWDYSFDSKIEFEYYEYLKSLRDKWQIHWFRVHPRYILQEWFEIDWEKIRPIFYISDFEIVFNSWWIKVIDIKGVATTDALIKRKLFLKKYWDKYKLIRMCKYQWDFVDYFENEKRRKLNRVLKKRSLQAI